MFENVTETVAWMMCIFVGAIIAIIAFFVYRQVKYVEETSNIYTELIRLNARYHFHNGILREYRIDERVSTKSKFDRFDFDAELDKHISANLEHYLDLFKKVYANQQGYQQYIQRANEVLGQQSEKGAAKKGLLYSTIEGYVCKKCKLHPILTTRFLCSVSYSSPKGKNQYHKKQVYSLKDVQMHYENVLQKQRRITDETRRRQAERAKMSPSLRYNVLKRDHFRCQICGATQADGVKLHVDHIVPIAKGGKTELSNLRTLCDRCNLGKGSQSE